MRSRLTILAILLAAFSGEGRAQRFGSPWPEPRLPRQASTPAAPASPSEFAVGWSAADPFRGSVPAGPATAQDVALPLNDAIERGLKNNLGLLLTEQGGRAAEANRWRALSALLPSATTRTAEWARQDNLEAFGFSGFPGVRKIVGPFGVFDTRVSVSQPILDFSSWHRTHAASARVEAANFSYQDAREMVVWVVANLYFRASAGISRVEAARSQLRTAEAVYRQAVDFKNAGVVPAIEVLRAQVESQAQQQRLIFFENEQEKQKLDLARAIGLPSGQPFHLTEELSEAAPPPLEFPDALRRAYELRADYQNLLARVRETDLEKKAALAERLPALTFNADYGDIGRAVWNSHGTFSAAASLELPLFQGGRIRGNILQADALLQQRRAELDDLRSRIEYEVRVGFLDLKAAQEQAQVARSARGLAERQMEAAQDRFAAGVTGNIEVVQAQEALATAHENYISSLYSYNIAKASLARTLGVAEKNLQQFLRGEGK